MTGTWYEPLKTWCEPLLRPELRNFAVGGVAGLVFAVVFGLILINGSTKTADAKLASKNPTIGSGVTVSGGTAAPVVASVAAPAKIAAEQISTHQVASSKLVTATAFAPPPSPNQSIAFQFNFDQASNATATYGSDFSTKLQGNRLYYQIMYSMTPDRNSPVRLMMREAADVKGADGRPGVLQLIGEAVPQNHELVLFKLCGEKDQTHFHLPHWKPGAVTMTNLRQTEVRLSYRIVRANPTDNAVQFVSISLEQNHPSNYDARLELDYVQTSSEWQILSKRLSQCGNVEKFLVATAENPDAGLQLVISSFKQPFRTGDRIEISDIKFFHEEASTAVSSTR